MPCGTMTEHMLTKVEAGRGDDDICDGAIVTVCGVDVKGDGGVGEQGAGELARLGAVVLFCFWGIDAHDTNTEGCRGVGGGGSVDACKGVAVGNFCDAAVGDDLSDGGMCGGGGGRLGGIDVVGDCVDGGGGEVGGLGGGET